MFRVLGFIQPLVDTLQYYGGYACFGLVLLPWIVLALSLPSILRRGRLEGRQINRFVERYNRIERGCCPDCGYDLRGSRRRCPQCGHRIPWDQYDAAR
jgi:hypothetical protein